MFAHIETIHTHTQTLVSIVWRAFKLDFVVETKEKAEGMVLGLHIGFSV